MPLVKKKNGFSFLAPGFNKTRIKNNLKEKSNAYFGERGHDFS